VGKAGRKAVENCKVSMEQLYVERNSFRLHEKKRGNGINSDLRRISQFSWEEGRGSLNTRSGGSIIATKIERPSKK
jgi:hypothetical protein